LEKQFRLLFAKAARTKGITGEILIQLLECRLDNIVYRLGLAATRAGARQLVTHRHVTLNGKVCNVPSCIVRPGDVVSVREKDRDMIAVVDALKTHKSPVVNWLSWDDATMQGTLLSAPERSEIPENIEVQLIVEFFSR
jgi:small subunit ribosomal protein S4